MRMKNIMLIPVFILLTGAAMSQPKTASLDSKWNNVLEDAETYQHYKVIKIAELNQLWRTVQDSVSGLKAQLKKEDAEIKNQQAQIKGLQLELSQYKEKLEAVSSEKDNMN